MTDMVPQPIRDYQIRLQNELRLDMASRLFPLHLKTPRRTDRVVSQLQSHSSRHETSSFDWLEGNCSDRPVVITGEPGSGKTTLLESFAYNRISSGEVAFFLRMSMWSSRRSLIEQLTDRHLTPSETREFMRSSETWILIDGLDEARGGPDAAVDDILALFTAFPAAKVVVSCRTGQFPPWAAPRFAAAALQPLRANDVEALLGPTGLAEASTASDKLREALPALHDLCRNPLMLSMTQELLLAGSDRVLQINSPGQLYNLFIELLEERERSRRQTTENLHAVIAGGINLRVLGYIAWRMMQDQRASISEEQLARWLEDMLRDPLWANWWGNDRPSVNTIVLALSNRLPLKSTVSLADSPSRVFSFLHLTFRDAFASRHLLYLSETLAGGIREVLHDTLEANNHSFWPAIVLLAGIEPEAGRTIRELMDLSFQSRRGDLLLLALRAATERWDTPSEDIGELVISILDAFKNWEHAFDSDLMRSGRALIPRLDPRFPRRIKKDLEYFTFKYAGLVPKDMPELSVNALVELLASQNDEHVINALHSLARFQYQTPELRFRVARKIEAYLAEWSGERFEQAVAALKDLGDPHSLSTLRQIATDVSAPARARAYATTGISELGDSDEAGILRKLLLDKSFVYRDSASWALQMLARKELAQRHPIVREIINVLMQSLRAEASDPEARYVRGNILYSLGMLDAIEYCDEIIQILEHETEPFVAEDGLICLGALGGPEHADIFRKYLRHMDPGVRLKAAEALQHLQAFDAADTSLAESDSFQIIRRVGHSMVAQLATRDQDFPASRAGRLVIGLLSRKPAHVSGVRATYQASQEEADALLAIYESRRYAMASAPRIMGPGTVKEVRLAMDDVALLLGRLRSEE
jgi:hypothetical protein